MKETLWLCSFILEVFGNTLTPTTIFSDNKSVIELSKDHQYHAHTKHINIRYHFIRWVIEKGSIRLIYCPTEDMLVDTLTKPLANAKAKKFASELGLHGAWGGVLKLQACTNVPASTLPFMHTLLHSSPFSRFLTHSLLYLFILLYSSPMFPFLRTHVSTYLPIYFTLMSASPQALPYPVWRLRWAPTLICHIIFFTYFVPSICYLLAPPQVI